MTTKRSTPSLTLGLLIAAGLFASAPASRADYVDHMTLDVSSLIGSPNGPFYLDLEVNQGDPSNPTNTVKLSNFLFTNGSLIAPLFPPSGNVSGDLSSGLTLSDSVANPFAFFEQGFTFGPGTTSKISFDMDITQNLFIGTPDDFVVQIFDSSNPNPLSTTEIDISRSISDASITVSGNAGVVVSIPDSGGTATLLGLSLAGVACCSLRRRPAMVA